MLSIKSKDKPFVRTKWSAYQWKLSPQAKDI